MNIVQKIGWPVAISFLAVSCTSTYIVPEKNTAAINFQTPETVTKAVVNDANGMDGFSVWGWYGKEGKIVGNVFDATEVTKANGEWGYEGTQYWMPGYVYDFYAVYPYGIAEYDEMGSNFIVKAFQTPLSLDTDYQNNVVDLMFASKEQMDGSNPEQVQMNFRHLLTRVNFAVKLADDMPKDYKVDIASLVFSAYAEGDLTLNKTSKLSDWSVNTESVSYFDYKDKLQNNSIIATGGVNTSVDITPSQYDLYLIPQKMDENIHKLRIAYRLMNDKQEGEAGYHYIDNEVTVPLSKVTSVWNPGESLTYTITISKYNVTVILNVGDWADGNTGNENIDFE